MTEYKISAGGDDGSWNQINGFTNTEQQVFFGQTNTTGAKYSFCRFSGVTIPAGATIETAYISFYFYSYNNSPPVTTLYFEDAANPSAISSASDGNGRAKTTNNISVTHPSSGTWWNTDSITAIIQELVDSYDYSSGAAMQAFIISPSGAANNNARSYSYDGGGASYCPKLIIEYTASGNPFYAYAQQ